MNLAYITRSSQSWEDLGGENKSGRGKMKWKWAWYDQGKVSMVEGAEQRRECYKIKIEKQAGTRVHETVSLDTV